MKDVMLDLETLASSSGAAIIQIGAIAFDWQALDEGSTLEDFRSFKRNVIMDGLEKRFEISGSTVQWWLQQSPEARSALFAPPPPVSLEQALYDFVTWVGHLNLEHRWRLWGNGATFDNVIFRNAFTQLGLQACWGFRQDYCYRTLASLLDPERVMLPKTGVAHDALDDAYNQAIHCARLLRGLNDLIAARTAWLTDAMRPLLDFVAEGAAPPDLT